MAEAYSLFRQKGYEKSTMRELAERADVGLGTIFKHFPDKPSLLVAVFREDIEAVMQNSLDTMPAKNIKMQLAHVATELFEFFGSNHQFSRSLIKETLFLQENTGDILNAQSLSFMKKIEQLFQEAIERAELDHKTDCRSGAKVFLSLFLSCLVGGLREPEFNIKKQALFIASLLDNYFACALKPKD